MEKNPFLSSKRKGNFQLEERWIIVLKRGIGIFRGWGKDWSELIGEIIDGKISVEVEDRRGEHLSRATAFINRRNIPPSFRVVTTPLLRSYGEFFRGIQVTGRGSWEQRSGLEDESHSPKTSFCLTWNRFELQNSPAKDRRNCNVCFICLLSVLIKFYRGVEKFGKSW